jgi:hypothetical protein
MKKLLLLRAWPNTRLSLAARSCAAQGRHLHSRRPSCGKREKRRGYVAGRGPREVGGALSKRAVQCSLRMGGMRRGVRV